MITVYTFQMDFLVYYANVSVSSAVEQWSSLLIIITELT